MSSTELGGIVRDACISANGKFRYRLTRRWGSGPIVAWLMLNPSTADAERDDPTLRRIMDFADHWGFHGVTVVNVYAYRTSQPAELWGWIGEDHLADEREQSAQLNRDFITDAAATAAMRCVGFGTAIAGIDRLALNDAVNAFGSGAMCLAVNAHGWPMHPMARGKHRIPFYTQPTVWTPPAPAPEHAHV